MGLYDYPDPGIDDSDRYEPRCETCRRALGDCDCCPGCGAGPDQACEPECGLGNGSPDDHLGHVGTE